MKKDLIIFLTIGIAFFLIDVSTFNYTDKSVYPILLIHHIINIFAQFGFLASDKRLLLIYIFAPIFTIIHWITNDNKCVLTQMVNERCGTHMQFRDIWFLLGFKKLKHYDTLHYAYLIVVWIIAIIRYVTFPR